MIELSPHEFGAVSSLFDRIEHNVALVRSVIEGNSPGRVFVDHREVPSSAYLVHEGAFHYVRGRTCPIAPVHRLRRPCPSRLPVALRHQRRCGRQPREVELQGRGHTRT